jgi:predicted PurR-regulated permease PerM
MTIDSNRIIKSLVILFLVVAALVLAKPFLVPLAIGALLAMLFVPMCNWLERHKFPRAASATVALLVVLVIVASICAVLSWQINGLAEDAPKIKQHVSQLYNQFTAYISNILGVSKATQEKMMADQKGNATSNLTSFIGSIGYTFIDCILVLVYMFLLLLYRRHIKQFALKLVSVEKQAEIETILIQASGVSQQYLAGLAKMVACLWVMYSIGFTIVGIDSSIFFAVLCGLLEIVPFVGNLTGSAITILVTVAQGGDTSMIAGIVITYGTVQFIQSWFIEPIIVGPQVRINALATIAALVVGELLWGTPGMILAIPITGMLKIFFDHVPALKPYGFLIGEVKEKGDKPSSIERFTKWFKDLFTKKA